MKSHTFLFVLAFLLFALPVCAQETQVAPNSIPPGTPLEKLAFAIQFQGVTAIADTDGDGIPDLSASGPFIPIPDPSKEGFTTLAQSTTTGAFYLASTPNPSIDPKGGLYSITIYKYDGTKTIRIRTFSLPDGLPVNMVVANGSDGDTLIVMLYFSQQADPFSFSSSDRLRVIAFPPAADRTPDGTRAQTLLNNGQYKIKDVYPTTGSFGGMALDGKGNLYVQVSGRNPSDIRDVDAAILVIRDTDGNGIPDTIKPEPFALGFEPGKAFFDVLLCTSISIAPNPTGGNTLYLSSLNSRAVVGDAPGPRIVTYADVDGDFKADGPPTIFYAFPQGQSVYILELDDQKIYKFFGTSHLDLQGRTLIYSSSEGVMGLGTPQITAIAIGDDGKPGAVKTIFSDAKPGATQFGKFLSFILIGRPTTLPVVAVTSPAAKAKTGGQLTVNWATQFSSPVDSHDILLSTDNGATFPTVLASGLSGAAQTATVTLPSQKIKQARIKVVAKSGDKIGEGFSGTFKIKPSK